MVSKIEEGKSQASWEDRLSAIAGGNKAGTKRSIRTDSLSIEILRCWAIAEGWGVDISRDSGIYISYLLIDGEGLISAESNDFEFSEVSGLSKDFLEKYRAVRVKNQYDLYEFFSPDHDFPEKGDEEILAIAQANNIVQFIEDQVAKPVSP